jgi:AcrR family transcriptional regulator
MTDLSRARRGAEGDEATSRTRDELIDAGERLYALRGIEGANLLAIAREAGQANKSAVQYHFGDRNGLIDAILARRVAWLETRRAERLAALPESADARALLEAMMAPLAELTDARGRRTYARFLLQFMIQFEPWPGVRHPLRRPHAETALDHIRARLQALAPHLSRDVLFLRLDWCMRTFLGLLVDHDNALDRRGEPERLGMLADEALDISAAVLAAPARTPRVSPS